MEDREVQVIGMKGKKLEVIEKDEKFEMIGMEGEKSKDEKFEMIGMKGEESKDEKFKMIGMESKESDTIEKYVEILEAEVDIGLIDLAESEITQKNKKRVEKAKTQIDAGSTY